MWDEGKVSPFFLFLFLSNIYFLQIIFFFFLSTKGQYHAASATGAAALVPMGLIKRGGGAKRDCAGGDITIYHVKEAEVLRQAGPTGVSREL